MTICYSCGQEHDSTGCPQKHTVYKLPFECPVCHGQKTVSRPPHVDGDVTQWTDSRTGGYPCKACNATGIVWSSHA